MPHVIIQDLFIIPEEVVPGRREGKKPFYTKLMHRHQRRHYLSVGGDDDKFIVPRHSSAANNIHKKPDMGFISEGNSTYHSPVVVRVGAVHGTGKDHCSGFLSYLLCNPNCIESIHTRGSVGPMLFNRPYRKYCNIAHLFRVLRNYMGTIFMVPNRISLLQFKLFLFFHINPLFL